MTYMTYNLMFLLMTFIPIILWLATSLWVAYDADKMQNSAWSLAGESKSVWITISLLLVWPFGFFLYLFFVRRKIVEISHSLNEDDLITKATNRLRKETNSKINNPRESASEASTSAPVTTTRTEAPSAEKAQVTESWVSEDHASNLYKPADENVFDYEESEPTEKDREVVIPPMPNRAPSVPKLSTEHDSSIKTTSYPVIPPKPNHPPRVGTPKDEESDSAA